MADNPDAGLFSVPYEDSRSLYFELIFKSKKYNAILKKKRAEVLQKENRHLSVRSKIGLWPNVKYPIEMIKSTSLKTQEK